MIGAIHHAALHVADLDEAQRRWSLLLGLTMANWPAARPRTSAAEREGADAGSAPGADRSALLRCTHEDYCLLLRPSQERHGIDYVAYELAPGATLDDARTRLREHGVSARETEMPRRGIGLRLDDPDGNGVVLIERRAPSDRRPAEVLYSDVLPGFHPRKFGHVNYLTGNVRRIVDWYVNVLGFKLTDWIGDEGAWLHVNADHHVLAFLEKGFNHLHHLAFELVNWGEFRVALDHLAQHRRPIVWGPGRHGMARNLFSYWRMPEEDMFIELFADLEQLPVDHVPRYYVNDAHSSNTWGILPPRSYFRFDDEAIQSELAQAEAYTETTGTT